MPIGKDQDHLRDSIMILSEDQNLKKVIELKNLNQLLTFKNQTIYIFRDILNKIEHLNFSYQILKKLERYGTKSR